MTDYGTQYVTVDNPTLTTTGGGAGWLWGILAIIAIIAAIVFLILWLVNRNKNNGQLSITGGVFNITSANQMRASWTAVGNSNDIVNLYVVRSGNSLRFNSDGTPTGSTTIVAKSGPISTPTLSAIASPSLTSGVSYTGYLVVTNSNISNNYNAITGPSLIVGSVGPTGAFHIQAVSQSGEMVYAVPEISGETGATGSVGYNFSGQTTLNNNLFFYDSNQNICTIPPSLSGPANFSGSNVTCEDFNGSANPTFVLTGNNSVLGLKQYDTSDATSANVRWTYDTTDNSWCLSNSGKSRCMQLSNLTGLVTSFVGGIDGTTLTVSSNNTLTVGQVITGQGVVPGTTITNLINSTDKTYQINISQTVSAGTTMTAQTLTPINIIPATSTNAGWTNINFTL